MGTKTQLKSRSKTPRRRYLSSVRSMGFSSLAKNCWFQGGHDACIRSINLCQKPCEVFLLWSVLLLTMVSDFNQILKQCEERSKKAAVGSATLWLRMKLETRKENVLGQSETYL